MKQARQFESMSIRLWSRALFKTSEVASKRTLRVARRILRSTGLTGPDVFSFTSKAELAQLLRLALVVPKGGAILEIGSHLGASARYLATGAARRGGRLYCIDTWQNETMPDGNRDTYSAFVCNTKPLSDWIVPIRKQSQALERSDVPEPLHLVFIDGDHSYQAVRRDVDLVLPLLHEGATIAFHDTTTFPGVGRCLGELLASTNWKICGNTESLTWISRARWEQDL